MNESCLSSVSLYLVCRLHALQDFLEQSNSTVTSFLRRCTGVESTAQHHTPMNLRGKEIEKKPTAINTTTKTTLCVWEAEGRVDLPTDASLSCSLSRVSSLNKLTSTLVKLGAVFASLVLHDRILGKVSAEALRLLLALSQPGEELADNDLWEMNLHFPIRTPPPPLPPTGLANLLTCSSLWLD